MVMPASLVVNGAVHGGDDASADLRALVLALAAAGLPVSLVAHDSPVGTPGDDLIAALSPLPTGPFVSLHAAPVHQLVRVDGAIANVARTSVHGPLDGHAIRVLQGFDEVWVSTEWEATRLRQAGVDELRVVHVPTPVAPVGDERLGGPFVFVSPFVDDDEAGADLVVQAWADAFRARDAVLLHLVLTGTHRDPAQVERDLQAFLRGRGTGLAPVRVSFAPVGSTPWYDALAGADALVRAPRVSDRGFDVVTAQASGLPVLVPATGALAELVPDAVPLRDGAPDVRRLRTRMRELVGVRGRVEPVAVSAAPVARVEALMAGRFDGPAPQWDTDVRRPLDLGLTGDVSVEWRGFFWNPSGYAAEARAFVAGLDARGWDVRARRLGAIEPGFRGTVPLPVRERVDRALGRRGERSTIAVFDAPAYAMHRRSGGTYAIGRSMFETSSLPVDWVEKLNAMDEVWVPTSFNAETFRSAGVTSPVHVVPCGVDTERFRPDVPAYPLPPTTGKVVLAVFQWGRRKGWDALITAWHRAFQGSDEATLVIRTSVPQQDAGLSKRTVEREIEEHLRGVGLRRRDLGHVVVLTDTLPDEALPGLYTAADALVAPSRGEGWGLPQIEALASGLPVLATRWGGTTAFLDDANSVQVEIEGLVDCNDIGVFTGQQWCEPSVESLTAALRRVVDDPAGLAELAAKGRRDVEERWTWDRAVDAAEERLRDVEALLRRRSRVSKPDAVRVRWEGRVYQHHSLATVNREWLTRLASDPALDVAVDVVEVPQQSPTALPALLPLALPSAAVPDVTVRHQWPPDLSPVSSGRLVLVQPWEYGGLPDEWVDALRTHVDEAWVYTSWLRDCYLRSGVPADKVHVVPLGVDTTLFTPDGARCEVPGSGVRLLFVGGAIPRKGLDLLLSAYREEFTAEEDVTLVVKAFGGETVYRGSPLLQAVREATASPGARVELLEDDLSPAQLAALYRSCDVLVHPYRGEGYGLTVAEGMASGLPVVTTGYGPVLDFVTSDEAELVPAREVPLPAGHGLPPSRAGYWWAEPSLPELRAALRRLVDDPARRAAMGKAAREAAVARCSWDVSVAAARLRGTTVFLHDLDLSGSSLDVVSSYVASFGAGDPATLVLQAPGLDGAALDEAAAVLTEVLASGTGGEPDVLLLTAPLGPGDLPPGTSRVLGVPAQRTPSSWRAAALLPPL